MDERDREIRREREVHVVDRGRSGGGAIAIVALVVLALVGFWMFGGGLPGGAGTWAAGPAATETTTAPEPAQADAAAPAEGGDATIQVEAAPAEEPAAAEETAGAPAEDAAEN